MLLNFLAPPGTQTLALKEMPLLPPSALGEVPPGGTALRGKAAVL